MPMSQKAHLCHQGVYTRKEVRDFNPRFVKVEVAGLVGVDYHNELFWCEVHLIGKGNKPLVCSVANDLEFTHMHGLKHGDRIEVQHQYVKRVQTI